MNRETLGVIGAAAVVAALAVGSAAWFAAPPPAAEAPVPERADALAARIASLQATVGADPGNVAAWKDLGRAYTAAGRYLAAVEAWSMVSELRPGDRDAAAAFARLDEIAARSGRHPEPEASVP